MKKLKFGFLITAFLLMQSCHDSFLTEKPFSIITPLNFYKTEEDINIAVTSIYNSFRKSQNFGRQIILAAEYPGEASWPNYSGESWRTELDEFSWTASSNGFKDIWSGLYEMVYRSNVVLQNVEKISFANPKNKEQTIGESRFMRALAYLYLVRFFENVPFLTEANMDEIYPNNTNTSDQVWQLIFEDLEFAKGNLKAVYDKSDVGRPTSGAAQVMLTKAYLSYAGRPWYNAAYWEKAVQEADGILNSGNANYDLEELYGDVFALKNEHGKEYIFSVEYISNFGVGCDWPTFTSVRNGDQIKLGGWSSLVAENDFFDSMIKEDKRREKTFILSYQGYSNPNVLWTFPGNIDLPHFNKYVDLTDDKASGTADYAINFYITRFADLLLMHSEAQNEITGPSDKALMGINRVRMRAGLEPLRLGNLTKETLREAIFQERLWEFCAEGHVWFDMKRMGLIESRIKKYDVNESHYVFPIPQSELDANANLAQNSAYR